MERRACSDGETIDIIESENLLDNVRRFAQRVHGLLEIRRQLFRALRARIRER